MGIQQSATHEQSELASSATTATCRQLATSPFSDSPDEGAGGTHLGADETHLLFCAQKSSAWLRSTLGRGEPGGNTRPTTISLKCATDSAAVDDRAVVPQSAAKKGV